jgi:hypothetical protein
MTDSEKCTGTVDSEIVFSGWKIDDSQLARVYLNIVRSHKVTYGKNRCTAELF